MKRIGVFICAAICCLSILSIFLCGCSDTIGILSAADECGFETSGKEYTEDGDFLWCVATPYMRNSCFELQDDKLIIYDGDVYIYHSKDGSFLGIENEENLDLDYN